MSLLWKVHIKTSVTPSSDVTPRSTSSKCACYAPARLWLSRSCRVQEEVWEEVVNSNHKPSNAMGVSILQRFGILAKRQTVIDRRSGRDRRKLYDVHYLSDEESLERLRVERRSEPERREDWIRVSKWGSVPTED